MYTYIYDIYVYTHIQKIALMWPISTLIHEIFTWFEYKATGCSIKNASLTQVMRRKIDSFSILQYGRFISRACEPDNINLDK